MSVVKKSLIGLATGDAMGTSVVGKNREDLLNSPVTNMISSDVELGTWSFNTSSVLCVINTIVKNGEISVNDIAHNFCTSLNQGKFTASSEAINPDPITKEAMKKYSETLNINCGIDEIKNSNGCLPRMLAVGLYAFYNKLRDREIYETVKSVCMLTHSNDVCILGCFIYVKYLLFILNGKDKYASYNMIKYLDYREFFDEDIIEYYNRLLKTNIMNIRVEDLKSDKYIVHTLETLLWVILNCSSFAETIVGAINLGESSDVIGSLSGSIAGILYDYDSNYVKWLNSLMKLEYLESEATRFEHHFK